MRAGTIGLSHTVARGGAGRVLRPLLATTLRFTFWGGLAFLSAVVIHNTLAYFSAGSDNVFFQDKAVESQWTWWRVCFWIHIVGGLLCLPAALPLFHKGLLRRAPRAHKILGWIYVVSVLLLLVPAGLAMSLYAKGGLAGQVGFLAIGFGTLHVTWQGLKHVLARDFKGHRVWMIRSYALVSSALSFRVFYLGLYVLGVEDDYVIALWLSGIVNLAIAEVIVGRSGATLRRAGGGVPTSSDAVP